MIFKFSKYFLSVLLFLLVLDIVAQQSSPNSIKAYFLDEEIELDGELIEDSWEHAHIIENFTQREQKEGEPATEQTKVAVLYNTNEIYFGIWCFDEDADGISAQQMARDFSWGSDDNFEILISPFNDNRNGYLFVTNPNGAMADVWIGDEGKDFNKDWNAVWDVAVQRNDEGWFIEMKIPFSTLKFKKEEVQTWAINFERNIRRKKEQVLWQGWSRIYDLEKISQAGKLVGIENIKQRTKVELMPYLLGGVEHNDKGWEDEIGWNHTIKVGGEVNIDITPTLKLNFTANTDFAQVESDRKQINLSRFSIRYPEKRQFFLEGKNYYDMNVGSAELFYSRRIGIENYTEVPIIGGGRFFGKLDKTNIGVMSIQTQAKDDIASTNYSVIKVQQDIFKQSSMGFMATQKYSKDRYNRVYGANFTYATSDLFGSKNLYVGGTFSASETKDFGSPENLNKDNLSYNVFLSYPNDQVEIDAGMTTIQKGFNPEMGFMSRNNYQMLFTEIEFQPRFKKLPFFRNLIFKPIDINYYLNEETKELESMTYEWRPFGFVTKSGEFFEFNVIHIFDKPIEDFVLISDVIIPEGSYWDNRYEIQFESFRGRKLATEAKASIGDFYTGSRQQIEIYTFINVDKHLNIGVDWERNYIQLPEDEFSTDEIGGRIDYAFNPKMHTSIFAQYNNEDDRVLVNYRINWIPKIGSYFYFVINQEYSTRSSISLERTTILGKLIWRIAL